MNGLQRYEVVEVLEVVEVVEAVATGAGRAVAPPLFDGSKSKIRNSNNRMANYSIQRQYSLRLQ